MKQGKPHCQGVWCAQGGLWIQVCTTAKYRIGESVFTCVALNPQLSCHDSDRPRRPGGGKAGHKLSPISILDSQDYFTISLIRTCSLLIAQVGDLPSGLGAREAKRLLNNFKQGEKTYFSLCLIVFSVCMIVFARWWQQG